MKRLLNISTHPGDPEMFDDDWSKAADFLDRWGFDGFELYPVGDYPFHRIPSGIIGGVHLRFFVILAPIWRGDHRRLLEIFGDWQAVEHFYGGRDATWIANFYASQLDLAKAFEAPYVVFHPVHCELDYVYDWQFPWQLKETLDLCAEVINAATATSSYKGKILFENLWWPGSFRLDRPEEYDYLLSRIDYPNCGIALDTGHLLNKNPQLENERQATDYLLDCIDRLGNLAGHIHTVHLTRSLSGDYIRKSQKIKEPYNNNQNFWSVLIRPGAMWTLSTATILLKTNASASCSRRLTRIRWSSSLPLKTKSNGSRRSPNREKHSGGICGKSNPMNRILFFLISLPVLLPCLLMSPCTRVHAETLSLQYAKGFTLERRADGILATIQQEGGNGYAARYLLVSKGKKTAIDDRRIQVISVPIRRLATLSTTHLSYIDAAGCMDRIVGLSSFEYVNTPSAVQRIQAGKIKCVGSFSNLNLETLMDLSPDLILASSAVSVGGIQSKLEEAGLPVLMITDFMEAHPLGRLEWIKFLGLLLGTEEHAWHVFDETAEQYKQLAGKASATKHRPRVLTGTPFQGQWWVARGDSYIARLIRDAGGEYLWSQLAGTGSVPMDVETVYERALDADIWINTGTWKRLDEAPAADPRFDDIPALEKGMLYNNNKRINAHGGNDFWESGMLHPEKVLADLIAIFHPELLPDHELVYYRQLAR